VDGAPVLLDSYWQATTNGRPVTPVGTGEERS
jgi:hypothetical protein